MISSSARFSVLQPVATGQEFRRVFSAMAGDEPAVDFLNFICYKVSVLVDNHRRRATKEAHKAYEI